MRSSIRTVAAEAGVSTATVSLVLRGVDGRTSPETRARVLEVAQRLNYLPVKPPTSQNRPIETRTVTLVPEHRDMENHELDLLTYKGIVAGARAHGYDVLTMVGQEANPLAGLDKSRYLDRRSDGFIFAVTNRGYWESALELVAEHGIPTVVCYRRDVPQGVAWADVDNAGAMAGAVELLVSRGHTRIAYLSGPPDNFDDLERRAGFCEAMRARGLEVRDELMVNGAGLGYVPDLEAMRGVADLGVTGVVCFNDTLALRLWETLESLGLNVPRDVSLVGMDNRPEAGARGLSSLSHSFAEVGRLAMEAWLELRCGTPAPLCHSVASVELIERNSVRDLRD